MIMKIKFAFAGLAALAISGCVSTQTISGMDALGYERFGKFGGAEAYACPAPKCASDNVVVIHKTDALSAKDKAELARLGDPSEASSIRATLNSLAGGSSRRDVKFGSPKRTNIGGRTAYTIAVTAAGDDPDGAIIILPDGNKAQLFAGLSERRADGARGATTLARQWARTQR